MHVREESWNKSTLKIPKIFSELKSPNVVIQYASLCRFASLAFNQKKTWCICFVERATLDSFIV